MADDATLLVVTQEHTPTGAHRTSSTPLHDWVSPEVVDTAARLSEADAIDILPPVYRGGLSGECEQPVSRHPSRRDRPAVYVAERPPNPCLGDE